MIRYFYFRMSNFAELLSMSNNSYTQVAEILKSNDLFLKEGQYSDTNNLAIIKQKFTDDLSTLTETQKNLKGLIFDKTTLQVVAPAVPVPVETAGEHFDDARLQLNESGINYIQPAYDGVLFRFYYYNDHWNFSTNGMITPNKGWNSNRTFQDLISEATENFPFENLDKTLCYYVILVHPDHHNVYAYSEVKLVITQVTHVGEGRNLTVAELSEELARLNATHKWFELNLLEPTAEEFNRLLESEEMNRIEAPISVVGWTVMDKKGNYYRFESKNFQIAKQLRANTPDVRKIWIRIRNNSELQDTYLKFFPGDHAVFRDMSRRFGELVRTFYSQYGRRYKLGEYMLHHSRHVKAMGELHQIYLDRKSAGVNNREASISETDIHDFLNDKPDRELFYLINPDNIKPTYREVSESTNKSHTHLVLE